MNIYIHCRGIRNPLPSETAKGCTVIIKENKITEILPGHIEPETDCQLLQWNNYTLIPGMFSCHEHVTLDSTAAEVSEKEMGAVFGIRAVGVCGQFLQQGVTTVRDAGSRGAVNIAIKKALADNLFAGPDLVVPGHRISRTGFTKWKVCREVDGPESLRKAVREEFKAGAEYIKLMVSGVVSGGGSPYDPQYSYAEIKAATEEAHDLGLKVGVHAYGGEGASRAIQAGVDSIEHGASLTDKDIEMMASQGTFFVMTYKAIQHAVDSANTPLQLKEKARSMLESYHITLPKIRKAGVPIVVGGDGHGFDPCGEASVLLDNGFSHSEALAALTSSAAVLCDMKDKGRVEPGFIADIIALDGDPFENIEALKNVKGVLKGGKKIK